MIGFLIACIDENVLFFLGMIGGGVLLFRLNRPSCLVILQDVLINVISLSQKEKKPYLLYLSR